jgi:hypothetical protein
MAPGNDRPSLHLPFAVKASDVKMLAETPTPVPKRPEAPATKRPRIVTERIMVIGACLNKFML